MSALHKQYYILYIPAWYQIGFENEIPIRITVQNNKADLTHSKRDSINFDEYINKRIEPLEKNFIQAVNNAREKLFTDGFVYSEAKTFVIMPPKPVL